MNIEFLCRLIKENFSKLRDEKAALSYLRYQFELLAWKRNKLKLGAVTFEIKEFVFHKTVLWEEVEIRYIRQDTSVADEQKLENILKRLGWQWDLRNYIALFVVVSTSSFYLYYLLKIQYQKYLPSLAFRSEHYDHILRHGFEVCFTSPMFDRGSGFYNYWLVDLLTDFSSHFNLIL